MYLMEFIVGVYWGIMKIDIYVLCSKDRDGREEHPREQKRGPWVREKQPAFTLSFFIFLFSSTQSMHWIQRIQRADGPTGDRCVARAAGCLWKLLKNKEIEGGGE